MKEKRSYKVKKNIDESEIMKEIKKEENLQNILKKIKLKKYIYQTN